MHNLNFETFLPTLYIGMILDPSVYNEPIVDKMNFLLTPSSYHGGSGSPIFFQCTSKLNNKEKVWIEFGGVQAAIESKFNSTIVVKPEQIISKIEELIKQN